ncbi:hypothetical protein VPNG_06864 [Cytospora leucostoma]|uniref:Uncharacterized protein n=1 Tax=Cytospora leucostoma TaxID=1230097 RepID=A0A423WVS4_9PEZI|nr:hypothetical protein VPNG_06864 [Cytospora leucostoma]
MCGTTWLEHDRCGHSERMVREDSKCAIWYAQPDSTFHLREAEGFEHVDDFCRVCQYRLKACGSNDPKRSLSLFSDTLSRSNSTSSSKYTTSDADSAKHA